MDDRYEQLPQDENSLSEQFLLNFELPEKRNSLGLYEIKYKPTGEVVFKCKSLTKLSHEVYRYEEALKLHNKED